MTHYRDLKQHTQPVFGRPFDPLRSGERHPPSYGKRFTAVNLGILDPSHIGGLREAEPARHSTRSEPSVLDAAGVSLDRSCPGESSRKPHDPGHKTLLRAPGRSARSGPPRDLTWLIVGRLGCWGLVVGGIVRVAWVEVRTDVGV